MWHSFTRDGTVDQYPSTYLAYLHAGGTLARFPTCKEHIDGSVRGVQACEDNMLPGELGWFGINPKSGKYDGLQFDEIEYLMAKSLAHNAPVSLQTGFAQMEQHPLTPDILEIIRAYEEVRAAGQVPPTVRTALREMGRDFVMPAGGSLERREVRSSSASRSCPRSPARTTSGHWWASTRKTRSPRSGTIRERKVCCNWRPPRQPPTTSRASR
ncbi:MAG: hypothetical protein ACLQNE_17910 [Thermoguttaceae bacterium]